jgi:hypothetical protein
VPRHLASWLIAWRGLIGVVVLGATNLFFISRRFGRRLVEGRFAHLVHLSPERLQRAEKWFERCGVLAIIFGRHIPGFRVPITVAAGVLKVRYPLFAPSVAVSTAIRGGRGDGDRDQLRATYGGVRAPASRDVLGLGYGRRGDADRHRSTRLHHRANEVAPLSAD